jgi:hypothetical protein
MALTITVQDGITFCKAYIKQQGFTINNQQPALGAAQIVLNTIFGPPFAWRTNRSNFSFPISTGGGTDYVVSVPTLGHIETQWMTDASGKVHQLNGAISLAKLGTSKQPTRVSPQYDDNAGNITFRFDSIPDQSYTAYFDFQQKAPLVTGAAQPLGTLPDDLSHLFFVGLLAWAGMLVNDSRFPIWEKRFIADLLSMQDGLDDQAKVIFMGEWMNFTKTAMRTQGGADGGIKGRTS